jgi:hypothetical protein
MRIEALIERLQEVADSYPGVEVMIATQPNYPLASTLRGVADPDATLGTDKGEDRPYVWLVEGEQRYPNPYAPGWVFEAAG